MRGRSPPSPFIFVNKVTSQSALSKLEIRVNILYEPRIRFRPSCDDLILKARTEEKTCVGKPSSDYWVKNHHSKGSLSGVRTSVRSIQPLPHAEYQAQIIDLNIIVQNVPLAGFELVRSFQPLPHAEFTPLRVCSFNAPGQFLTPQSTRTYSGYSIRLND